MRSYTVFSHDQVDGIPADRLQPTEPTVTADPQQRYEVAEAALQSCGASVRHGGDRAFYMKPVGEWPQHVAGDHIQMPNVRQFASPADYLTTLAHEHFHWSEVRLGWTGSYALGELVAELGSCYLAAELNVPTGDHVENHAAYLAHWIRELRDDDRALFKAAARASKACDYLLKFSRPAGSKDRTDDVPEALAA